MDGVYFSQGIGGVKVVNVNVHRATFKGKKVDEMTSWERKKFDNHLFLANASDHPKISYH